MDCPYWRSRILETMRYSELLREELSRGLRSTGYRIISGMRRDKTTQEFVLERKPSSR